MHGTAYLHHTLLTVTDEQLQPLRSDQQHPMSRASLPRCGLIGQLALACRLHVC
jgi:hypothetical protein